MNEEGLAKQDMVSVLCVVLCCVRTLIHYCMIGQFSEFSFLT